MAAQIDKKAGSRITYDKNGYRVERMAKVSGVTGSIESLLVNAINDGQLPNYGDAHPDATLAAAGITLRRISCQPEGGGQYKIVMSYYEDKTEASGSSNATGRITAATSVEQAKTDINGNEMATVYTHAGTVYNEVFKTDVERPRQRFEFSYTSATAPTAEINTYNGKINSAIWNGFAVETILCDGITADEQGDGTWKVRFSFSYNPDTWQYIAKVSKWASDIDSSTDVDLDQTNGTKGFDVYEQVDFTPLGFTF